MRIKPILWLCLLLCGGGVADASALLKPTMGATQNLRAKSLEVRADINGAFAHTTATTVYANPNNRQIEADFIYTAPENATVTGFAYWFKGERVVARVVEKERAADIYRLITVRRRDPALVEMIGKNTFRARIAPVEAGADLKIEVRYIEPLRATADGWKWSYPLAAETKNHPLDAVNFSATIAGAVGATSNFGQFAGNVLKSQKTEVQDAADVEIDVPAPRAPLKVSVFAARDGGSDGFFALALAPNFSATKPSFAVSGVQTYDIMRDENARAGQTFVAVGRYRGAGEALVKLGKRSVNVRFDDARKPDNIAAKLWGARRIEELSQSDANRAAVINLSKRFGMPSKWTSWLALPASEKAAFEQRLLAYETDRAIERWAQSVASGDEKRAKILRERAYDYRGRLNKLSGNNQELTVETFRNALNEELDRVIAARDEKGADKAKLARLERNLRARGAVSYRERNEEQRREYQAQRTRYNAAKKKLEESHRAFLDAVKKGDLATAKRQKLRSEADFQALEKIEKGAYDPRPSATQQAIEKVAFEIENARKSGIADSPRQQELLIQLRRLLAITQNSEEEVLQQALTRAYAQNLRQAYELLTVELKNRREEGPEARRIRQRIRELKPLVTEQYTVRNDSLAAYYATFAYEQGRAYAHLLEAGKPEEAASLLTKIESNVEAAKELGGYYGKVEVSQVIGSGWQTLKNEATSELARLIAAKRENSPEANAARARIEKAAPLASDVGSVSTDNSYSIIFAWKGRAHETAYLLLKARQNGNANLARKLEAQLKVDVENATYAPFGANNAPLDAYIEWEKSRIKRGEPVITSENYILRPGDPLISVSAPANCQRVVAILPSGELLPLVYNADKRAWEARFDVPTYALEGAYQVQIVIVSADGARHVLAMNFNVDTTAPDGIGGAIWGDKSLNLQLQTDEQTDRVSAFTPWNERLELRRDASGIFVARADVPDNWRDRTAKIRFVLTDQAHNRTEIEVDWSQ